jgi:hypothetical protein
MTFVSVERYPLRLRSISGMVQIGDLLFESIAFSMPRRQRRLSRPERRPCYTRAGVAGFRTPSCSSA